MQTILTLITALVVLWAPNISWSLQVKKVQEIQTDYLIATDLEASLYGVDKADIPKEMVDYIDDTVFLDRTQFAVYKKDQLINRLAAGSDSAIQCLDFLGWFIEKAENKNGLAICCQSLTETGLNQTHIERTKNRHGACEKGQRTRGLSNHMREAIDELVENKAYLYTYVLLEKFPDIEMKRPTPPPPYIPLKYREPHLLSLVSFGRAVKYVFDSIVTVLVATAMAVGGVGIAMVDAVDGPDEVYEYSYSADHSQEFGSFKNGTNSRLNKSTSSSYSDPFSGGFRQNSTRSEDWSATRDAGSFNNSRSNFSERTAYRNADGRGYRTVRGSSSSTDRSRASAGNVGYDRRSSRQSSPYWGGPSHSRSTSTQMGRNRSSESNYGTRNSSIRIRERHVVD